MTSYTFDYQYSPGSYRGRAYQIGVRVDPDLNHVESFAVLLFYESSSGEIIEIVKVDNAEHEEGTVHVDRYYREQGTDYKDFDVDFETVYEAEDYVEVNFRQFARHYDENHGDDPHPHG